MNHLHPGFALALLLEAFIVLLVLRRWILIEPVSGHASAIDGLRGFLAFGEMTYSLYLLHGPLLFIAFPFVFGFHMVEQLSPVEYWGAVALLVPVLLGLSAFSFKYFEQWFMRRTTEWTTRLRLLSRHVES
jgi:peptidoglycan/LPS O-acetylase OafA/YrhL